MNRRFVTRMAGAWIYALLALPLIGMAEAGEDPVAMRVGDFCYSRSTLKKTPDSMLELSELLKYYYIQTIQEEWNHEKQACNSDGTAAGSLAGPVVLCAGRTDPGDGG